MPQGTVKWFSAEKGYGFIEQEGGKPDIFVHWTGIAGEGFRKLAEGDRVEYQATERDGRPIATEVRKIEG